MGAVDRRVVTRAEVAQAWRIDNAVRGGHLVRLFPGVYVDAAHRDETAVRRAAAVRYLAGRGALSHTTALDVWRVGWYEPDHAPIHASVPPHVRLRTTKGMVIHRSRGFMPAQRRGGYPVTPLARSIVDSWPLLPAADRVGVVAAHHANADDLLRCLAATPKLTGAAELRRVLALVKTGCHSALELHGAMEVFDGILGLKHQVRVAGFTLDVYAERQRVAFELDGAAFHGDRVRRERDLRRDAILATHGIQVVRFSYARLTTEAASVRREVQEILASRSHW
jgi:very-short-patch-repair endonuclease